METETTTSSLNDLDFGIVIDRILDCDAGKLSQQLLRESGPMVERLIAVGEESFQMLESNDLSVRQRFDHSFYNFLWPEKVKRYLILWRDVIFEQQKCALMIAEGKASEEDGQRLHDASVEIIQEATNELSNFYQEKVAEITRKNKFLKRQVFQWQLQKNPWPAYRDQIEKIPGQCSKIAEDHQILMELVDTFSSLKKIIRHALTSCREEIEESKALIGKIIKMIETEAQKQEDRVLNKLEAKLEDVETSIIVTPHIVDFSAHSEEYLGSLPEKVSFVKNTRAGWLEIADINIRRRAQQWMESQVLPVLYEVWELTENSSNRLKMTLVNIRNRAILLGNETRDGLHPEVNHQEIAQPLEVILQGYSVLEKEFEILHTLIEQRLVRDFEVSAVYDIQHPFLPVPTQSPVRKFDFPVIRKRLTELRDKIMPYMGFLNKIWKSVEKGEVMSVAEKVARYIEHRRGPEANPHYASIFLTKGYVGESFIVGRKDELRHIENLLSNWKNGFRGSVAITGKRLSGKSLFGELIATRYFPEDTIRVNPSSIIEIKGRKMETGYDLGKALGFIRKYTLNDRPLIWIDDLELWWSTDHSLNENVRQLTRYIDHYGSSQFIIVSMGNALFGQLNRLHKIDRIFQANINMDVMSHSEIQQAILIRHGATHRQLVSEEGEELTPRELSRQINHVYRASRGNVGDALNLWSRSTHMLDENRVYNNFEQRWEFPETENTDAGLLLATIVLLKRANEYQLRKLFGPAFQEKYIHILRRLISVGILKRQLDGYLEINDLVINDLEVMLAAKNFINYQ